MALPTWATDFLNSASRIHAASLAVKVLGLAAALGVGILGHDWKSASGIAIGALATSSGASVAASAAAKK